MTNGGKIYGTWDFKWPQGKVIRVAVQELRPEWGFPELNALIESLRELAKQWTTEANIFFSFDRRILPPPPAPVEEKQFARSDLSDTGQDYPDYDILVSFAPLPLWFKGSDGVDVAVTGQTTALGSYARRIDYGVPSMLLGPNMQYLSGGTVAEYFASRPYRHIALHELGHTLGFAHGHQNPRYRAALRQTRGDLDGLFKKPEEVENELKKLEPIYRTRFSGAGPEKLKKEIEEELKGEWPHEAGGNGAIGFSDWGEIPVGPGQRLENQTVMAHPRWSDFFDSGASDAPIIHERLPDFDRSMIKEMYPPAAKAPR